MIKKILLILTIVLAVGFSGWVVFTLLFTVTVDDGLPVNPTIANTATNTEPVPKPTTPITTAATDTDTVVIAVEESDTGEVLRTSQELGPFPITDTDSHPASGSVRLIITPEEQLVRFENYQGTDGPSLKVYLAKDLGASDYIDLGPAKGNAGNINYGVPLDVNISAYQYVITWDEDAGESFDYAKLK